MSAKTAPTGASIVVDILRSTNQGTSFTSLWSGSPGSRPAIAATTKYSISSSFVTNTLNKGDLFRIDVIQVGSTVAGQDITVQLSYANINPLGPTGFQGNQGVAGVGTQGVAGVGTQGNQGVVGAAGTGFQDHRALTHITDNDGHTQYIYNSPATSTRNDITSVSDVVAFRLKSALNQASNLMEVNDNMSLGSVGVAACIGAQGYLGVGHNAPIASVHVKALSGNAVPRANDMVLLDTQQYHTGDFINTTNSTGPIPGGYNRTVLRLKHSGDLYFGDLFGSMDLAAQGGVKIGTTSTQLMSFWGATPIARPTVSGSKGGNAALASLLTALANAGLITDSTT